MAHPQPLAQSPARFIDVYLTWGEPPPQVARKIAWMRELAHAADRTLRFGIRLHTISRDSSKQAWAEANRLLAGLSMAEINGAQKVLAKSASVGQERMLALHSAYRSPGRAESATLWAAPSMPRRPRWPLPASAAAGSR